MSSEVHGDSLRYIPDEEILLGSESDLLGTEPYVDVLERTIRECQAPFTIGLFGSWGSGKSSIVATLRKRLEGDKREAKGIWVFVYDAWKYSGDSFYRSFLLQLKEDFRLDSGEEFNQFYADQATETDHKYKVDKTFWPRLAAYSPLIILVAWLVRAPQDVVPFAALLSIAATVVGQILSNAFVVYRATINRPRVFAPEQFATAFNSAIDEVLGRVGCAGWFRRTLGQVPSKILIVIDNIDRCDGPNARDLLMSVKNFLERKDVIFLLPLDPSGVKKFLRMKEPGSSEYLRKIFNATLTIKPFTAGELYDFAQSLNRKYQLGLPETAISLTCQEFAANPRRVIQFLNTLQNELALASELERHGSLQEQSVTGNVPFLAKMLVLREEWPHFYQDVSADPGLLQKTVEAIVDGRYQPRSDDLSGDRYAENLPSLEKGLYRFLQRSQPISATSLDPFLVNRDLFIGIPDSLYGLVISQSWDDIQAGMAEGLWTLEQVIEFALYIGDREVVQRGLMSTTGFNVLALLGAILHDEQYAEAARELMDEEQASKIAALCESKDVDYVMGVIKPERLTALMRYLHDLGHPGLHDRVITFLLGSFARETEDNAAA